MNNIVLCPTCSQRVKLVSSRCGFEYEPADADGLQAALIIEQDHNLSLETLIGSLKAELATEWERTKSLVTLIENLKAELAQSVHVTARRMRPDLVLDDE